MKRVLSTVALSVLLGGASPPAAQEPAHPIPAARLQAIAADLNGDGLEDIVAVSDGSVRLRFSARAPVQLGLTSHVVALAVGDADGDGDRDIVALSRRGRLIVWRNDGAGHFSGRAFVPVPLHPRTLRSTSAVAPCDGLSMQAESFSAAKHAVALVRVFVLDGPGRAGPLAPTAVGIPNTQVGRFTSSRAPPIPACA